MKFFQKSVCCAVLLCAVCAANAAGAPPARPNPGILPYPIIDVTNGIPPWVSNYNNNTQSAPQNKGSYVRTYDNSTNNGKIIYQTYSQTGTDNTVATLPKGNQRPANNPTTYTVGSDK